MEEPESRVCRGRAEAGSWDAEIGADMAEIASVYDVIDNVDFDPTKLQIEEGMVAEVMKRLEEEINQPPSCVVGGGGGLVCFRRYQSAPFVTINGNEESCGPSFSDSASTVMANIDTCGAFSFHQLAPIRAQKVEAEAEAVWPWYAEVVGSEDAFDGPAEGAFGAEHMGVGGDHRWLANVLAGAGLEGEGEEETLGG